MANPARAFVVPVLLIAVGTGWLLSTLGLVPEIDWVWTLGLATIGILTFILSGVDKLTVVVGPFFLAASLLSVLRQTGRIRIDLEIPILVILLGFLMILAQLRAIPYPRWILEDPKRKD